MSKIEFLSTPSARRATLPFCAARHFIKISIHALREEGDLERVTLRTHFGNISIHALREEGDGRDRDPEVVDTVFLSTPSARRATDGVRRLDGKAHRFSIHALREEGDPRTNC